MLFLNNISKTFFYIHPFDRKHLLSVVLWPSNPRQICSRQRCEPAAVCSDLGASLRDLPIGAVNTWGKVYLTEGYPMVPMKLLSDMSNSVQLSSRLGWIGMAKSMKIDYGYVWLESLNFWVADLSNPPFIPAVSWSSRWALPKCVASRWTETAKPSTPLRTASRVVRVWVGHSDASDQSHRGHQWENIVASK